MNKMYNIFLSTLIILLLTSCIKKNENLKREVQYYGALRKIMSGNIESTISLDSFSDIKNLYALGALENLKGEIQIFNGSPSNSIVKDNSIKIDNSYELNAALLVYAEVEKWHEFNLKNVTTKNDLEESIFKIAKSKEINTNKPFPFLLKGQVNSVNWHVINWVDGDTIHTHEKHKESGLKGVLNDKNIEIIGFYSTKHKGVFIHHTTNMHMHFKTDDDSLSGHVDNLILNDEIILKLPKQ